MTVQHADQPKRLTADAYLAAATDAFGDIEIADGLVINGMAQSELHDLVIQRLAAALENARPPGRALLPGQLRRSGQVR